MPVAGPSKPAPARKNGRKAQKEVVEVDVDVEEELEEQPAKDVTVVMDSDEEEEDVVCLKQAE